IGQKNGKMAILISFDTNGEAFESPYERNKFFAELHGRKQIVVKDGKRYEYEREGLLDEIPNLRVDNSVFIIMQEHMKMMERFFNAWQDKVMFKSFPVLLDNRQFQLLEKAKRPHEEKDKEKEVEIE
ncbi:MAG: hypothetical protein QXD77_02605, partial [Candidatus Aenigmatarchaeota archaeon]